MVIYNDGVHVCICVLPSWPGGPGIPGNPSGPYPGIPSGPGSPLSPKEVQVEHLKTNSKYKSINIIYILQLHSLYVLTLALHHFFKVILICTLTGYNVFLSST